MASNDQTMNIFMRMDEGAVPDKLKVLNKMLTIMDANLLRGGQSMEKLADESTSMVHDLDAVMSQAFDAAKGMGSMGEVIDYLVETLPELTSALGHAGSQYDQVARMAKRVAEQKEVDREATLRSKAGLNEWSLAARMMAREIDKATASGKVHTQDVEHQIEVTTRMVNALKKNGFEYRGLDDSLKQLITSNKQYESSQKQTETSIKRGNAALASMTKQQNELAVETSSFTEVERVLRQELAIFDEKVARGTATLNDYQVITNKASAAAENMRNTEETSIVTKEAFIKAEKRVTAEAAKRTADLGVQEKAIKDNDMATSKFGKQTTRLLGTLKQLKRDRSERNLNMKVSIKEIEKLGLRYKALMNAQLKGSPAENERTREWMEQTGVLKKLRDELTFVNNTYNRQGVGMKAVEGSAKNYTKTTGRMNAAISNGSFAIQDFVTVLQGGGGLERALLSTTNNLGMISSLLMGGWKGAIAGVVAALAVSIIPLFKSWFGVTEEVNKALRENYDEMDANKEGTIAWARAVEDAHSSIVLLNAAILAGEQDEHNARIDSGEKGIKKYKNSYMELLAAHAAVTHSMKVESGAIEEIERKQSAFAESAKIDIAAIIDLATLGSMGWVMGAMFGNVEVMDKQHKANSRLLTGLGTGVKALIGDVWKAASQGRWLDAWGSSAEEMQEQLDIEKSALEGQKILFEQANKERAEEAEKAREQQAQLEQLAQEEKDQALMDEIDSFTKSAYELEKIALQRKRDQMDIMNEQSEDKEGFLKRSIAIQESFEFKMAEINKKEKKRLADEEKAKKKFLDKDGKIRTEADIKEETARKEEEKRDKKWAKQKSDFYDELFNLTATAYQKELKSAQDEKDLLLKKLNDFQIFGAQRVAALKAMNDKIDAINKKEEDKTKGETGEPEKFGDKLTRINAQRASQGLAPIMPGSKEGRALQRQSHQEQQDFQSQQFEGRKGVGGMTKKWQRYYDTFQDTKKNPARLREFEGITGALGDIPMPQGRAGMAARQRGTGAMAGGAVMSGLSIGGKGGGGDATVKMLEVMGINNMTGQMNQNMMQTIIDEIGQFKKQAEANKKKAVNDKKRLDNFSGPNNRVM